MGKARHELTLGDQRQLRQLQLPRLPVLIQRSGPEGWRAFLNFFGATIRNDNTRTAYLRAVCQFLEGCEASGIHELRDIEPFMVGSYVSHLQKSEDGGHGLSKSSVKQKLAAVRRFLDHLVVAQVIPANPALSVRGPRLKVRKGKSPHLKLEQLQELLESIDRTALAGKRDFAWLTLAATAWCRVSALVGLTVADYWHEGKRSFIRVQEKGGEDDGRMPVHHKAQEALDELIEAARIADESRSPIFQSVTRSGEYTGRGLRRERVWDMVRRRARQAGVNPKLCCHSLRATGITLYLEAGGDLKRASDRAHHADTRTTKLYDHSDEDVTLEDVELVQF